MPNYNLNFVESNSINFDLPKKIGILPKWLWKYYLRWSFYGLSPPAIYQLKRGQWDNLNLIEYDVVALLDYLNEF